VLPLNLVPHDTLPEWYRVMNKRSDSKSGVSTRGKHHPQRDQVLLYEAAQVIESNRVGRRRQCSLGPTFAPAWYQQCLLQHTHTHGLFVSSTRVAAVESFLAERWESRAAASRTWLSGFLSSWLELGGCSRHRLSQDRRTPRSWPGERERGETRPVRSVIPQDYF